MLYYLKKYSKHCAYLLSICLLTFLSASSLDQRMHNDLFFIKEIFDGHYAPKIWKEKYANWNLEAEIQNVEAQLNHPDISIKKFQKLIKDLTLSAKDYHVGVYFYATEEAHLPFYVKSAEGRYFISHIKSWAPSDFPFQVGDEIITFGGKPIDQVVQDLKKELLGDNVEITDQGLAEIYLTNRVAKIGATIPQGKIVITGKDCLFGLPRFANLTWDYTPEKITDWDSIIKKAPILAGLSEKKYKPPFIDFSLLNKDMSFSYGNVFEEALNKDMRNPHSIGSRYSMLPPLGNIIWSTDKSDPFEAYLFETPNQRLIGFLRIPHYNFDDNEAKELEMIIDFFQTSTEALIIDQQNNYGGLVLFSYGVMSMLTDHPLVLPKHRMMLRQQEIFDAHEMIENFSCLTTNWQVRKFLGDTWLGYPMNIKFVESMMGYCQFMIDQWNEGKLLSDPGYLYIDAIDPHPKTHYTKPIFILINALDFSCGDFVPAIMQDNKRAILIGTRTAGAGGYIDVAEFPNYSGIARLRYSASIAERLDKTMIENLGVQPDIEYKVTAKDLQRNFEPYAKFILKTVENELSKSQ